MKISYKRLWVLLIQRDITKVTLKREVGISAGTMCKLNKGEEVTFQNCVDAYYASINKQ